MNTAQQWYFTIKRAKNCNKQIYDSNGTSYDCWYELIIQPQSASQSENRNRYCSEECNAESLHYLSALHEYKWTENTCYSVQSQMCSNQKTIYCRESSSTQNVRQNWNNWKRSNEDRASYEPCITGLDPTVKLTSEPVKCEPIGLTEHSINNPILVCSLYKLILVCLHLPRYSTYSFWSIASFVQCCDTEHSKIKKRKIISSEMVSYKFSVECFALKTLDNFSDLHGP